ncbi:MAG TPA: hypothetical protein ENI97_02725 [Gammaproteobacteria bacterium]|nr:hypothetical protein [Gammaproteobacteria bacterium]
MSEQAIHPAYDSASRGNVTEIPMGGGKKNGRIRELIMPSSGSGKTYLKFRDERFTWYNVPLGKAATRGRDEAPTPLKNVIIPILPRVYATPDLDPAQCDVPRQGGYLYIYKNGHLWREFEVLAQGWFREVNLHKYAGRDERPATVEKDNRILVLHRINGEDQDIEMTYSEVQWSWARINQLGGMDPNDFRLHPDHLPPMPEDQGITPGKAAELREARLQKIDLSGFEDGFPVQPPEGHTAHIENVANANDDLIHIRLHHKCDIPVVYLHDTLGIARRLAAEHQGAWQDMADYIAEISNPDNANRHTFAPWFDSAVLANQYFFVDPPVEDAPNVAKHPGKPSDGDWEKAKELREEWRKKLSLEDIQTALGTKRRAELRQAIVEKRQALADYLQPESETFDGLLAAWDDYCTLPAKESRLGDDAPHCGLRYRLADELFARLADHEYVLDLHLETKPPSQKALHELARNNPGRRLLAAIGKPGGHPLHERLFPTRDEVPPDSVSPLMTTAILARIGRRSASFIAAFVEHYAHVAADLQNAHLQEQIMDLITKSRIGLEMERVSLTLEDYFEGRLPESLAKDYEIVRMEVLELDKDIPYRRKRDFDGGEIEIDGQQHGPIQINDQKGNLIATTTAEAYRQGRGFSRSAWKRYAKSQRFASVKVKVWVTRKVDGVHALARQAMERGIWLKAIIPLTVVLEAWNLQNAIEKVSKSNGNEKELAASLNQLGNAVADSVALVAYLNEIRLKSKISSASTEFYKKRVFRAGVWTAGLGLGANVYSGILSLQDMLRNVNEGDDASVGHGVMMSGFALGAVGNTLQLVGAGASLLGIEVGGLLGAGVAAAGTIALIGLAVLLIGAALLIWVFREDTPMEEWLVNGPFGVDPDDPSDTSQRFAGYDAGKPAQSRFHIWYLQPRTAYEDLLNVIFQPVADLRFHDRLAGTREAEAIVHVPTFYEDHTRLYVEWWERPHHGEWRRADERDCRLYTPEGSGPRTVTVRRTIARKIDEVRVRIWLDLYGDQRYRLPMSPLQWSEEQAEQWRKEAVKRNICPVSKVRIAGNTGNVGKKTAPIAGRGVRPIELTVRTNVDRFKAL